MVADQGADPSAPSGDSPLGALSETLFLPLYALAIESGRANPILADPGTVELVRRLDAALATTGTPLHRRLAARRLPGTLVTTLALRIRRYDRYVADFLARHPDAVVVNLGCGLDDRRRRVDDGQVRWVDVDLPEVIALRRRFLPETDRMRFVAGSVLERGWLADVPAAPGERVLVVAEGLFMYLPADGVRALVRDLAAAFPGAELVAEVAHARIVGLMRTRLGRTKFRRQFGVSGEVAYRFGMADSRAMEAWAPGLVLLDDWTYFDEPEPRLRWMRPMARLSLFRRAQWTVHYRLGRATSATPEAEL